MSDDIAIKVENLSKCYPIFDAPRDRLKQMVYPRVQRLFGCPGKRYYREFWALKDVSFEVRKGEALGIIGRNGSGKSTLLQIIAGTLAATSGTFTVRGRVVALLELGSGFNPEFTGEENIYLTAALYGLSPDETRRRFPKIVEFAEIGDFIKQPIKTYSSGMTMRLAFSILTQVDADVLIVDEALSVGDVFFTQKCMRYIHKFAEKNVLLFVSHSTESIVSLCDKALWLKDGTLMKSGAPKNITRDYISDLFNRKPVKVSHDQNQASARNNISGIIQDVRRDIVLGSNLRNDLTISHFDFSSDGVGSGKGVIQKVAFVDAENCPLTVITGGEVVTIEIKAEAIEQISTPIIGFSFKNSLGLTIFGDNTYLKYMDAPLSVSAGQLFRAKFQFVMPTLPAGDFMLECSLAEGSQTDFVMLHKIAEALPIKAQRTMLCHGQLAIPMHSIRLEVT
jgi:lipopolysaccharide transport system ATP-binding protein